MVATMAKRSSVALMRRNFQEVSPKVYKRNLMAKRNNKISLDRSDFANATLKRRIYKRKLVLLLPAHNEELIIQATINSAIKAGQRKEDIFVVDDNSTAVKPGQYAKPLTTSI
jgi:hypothetical protein